LVVDGVVVDENAELGKHLGDLTVKIRDKLRRLSIVVRNSDQRSVAADVLHELESLDNFAWIGARTPNENRHAFFYRLYSGGSQGFEFIPEQIVALSEAACGGDDIDTVFDHAIDARLEIIHVERRGRIQITRILRRERPHHRHHSLDIFGSYHRNPP